MASEKGAYKSSFVADMGKDILVDSLKTAATNVYPYCSATTTTSKAEKLIDHKGLRAVRDGASSATILCGAGRGI